MIPYYALPIGLRHPDPNVSVHISLVSCKNEHIQFFSKTDRFDNTCQREQGHSIPFQAHYTHGNAANALYIPCIVLYGKNSSLALIASQDEIYSSDIHTLDVLRAHAA